MKIRNRITIALIASLVIVGSVRPVRAQAKESFSFLYGVENMLLGNLDKATAMFQIVIKENPIHAPSYFFLGRIAMSINQMDDASTLVGRAIEIDSINVTYLNTFAQILIQTKQYAEAETLISRLRTIDPHNQQNYQLGAALLLEIGKADQARQLCEQYEQLFGLDERIVDLQRSAYIQTENYFTAEQFMRRVVAAFPTAVEPLLSLADLNAALMRDSIALSYYDQAIAMDSTAVAPRLAKANFHSINKNTTQYINELIPLFGNNLMSVEQKTEIFEKHFFTPEPYRENFALVRSLISTLLLTYPDNAAVRLLYGRYLIYSGQVEAAEQHYSAMIDQDIKREEAIEPLLQIYFYQKKYAQAFDLSTTAYAAEPTAEMMEYRAIAAWLNDDPTLALTLVNQAIRVYRADSVRSGFYALRGDIYEKIGQPKQSYQSYNQALRLNPSNFNVLNNYAYHLAVEGRELDRALKMAQKANALAPDNPTYLDTEAWVLFKLGRYVDAQIIMGRVIALDARPSAEVLLHYGDILYELGDDFLARNYWKRAAQAGATAEDIDSRTARPKAKLPTNE